jgi:hypothetical protein
MMRYVCLLGCPLEEGQGLQRSEDYMKIHYVFYHGQEELKMWGINRELLKTQLGGEWAA